MADNISVIIPALNEERTIASTVSECLKSKGVLEVIVVDDRSSDRTVELAAGAGARVVVSQIRGKGKSMEDGLREARGSILVYVDADIKNFSQRMVDSITAPLLRNRCDFVKSRYGRRSGRVTELVAKPLLSELFPTIIQFRQPLSGIIAGRKWFFERVSFENDYGVDVGILIDMVNSGARIMEVDIGYIEHKMKPWRKLVGMSTEVARSILKRAKLTNRAVQESIAAEAAVLGNLMEKGAQVAFPVEKVAFLDMDGTILSERFIFSFARSLDFEERIEEISGSLSEPFEKTQAIASSLRGYSKNALIAFARKMKLSPGAQSLVRRLKKAGYFTVLITDSYQSVALAVAGKVGADMVIANRLKDDDGICNGEVEVNPLFLPIGPSCSHHAVCKLTAALRFCTAHALDFTKVLAVGDGPNDNCLLRFANQSFAYRPKENSVAEAAKNSVSHLDEVFA
ncbi:MAG TPA: HAD-IB family phosphatase [Candidatus Bilamarchaeum sp.]|nr:HAD-IB family phosphatase [Candidatus Bilamarchaeum sp.]